MIQVCYVHGIIQVWKMSSSSWMSELQQEGIEHQLPNDYLQQVTPSVFNYGVELELPRVRVVQLISSMSY